MVLGYSFGQDYPSNPLDFNEPTEFRYRIESDNLPETADRFRASRLFTDSFMETEKEAHATAQLMANELGVAVEFERWTLNGWGEPHEVYDTVEVQPNG